MFDEESEVDEREELDGLFMVSILLYDGFI
jgi:hypothetical protein